MAESKKETSKSGNNFLSELGIDASRIDEVFDGLEQNLTFNRMLDSPHPVSPAVVVILYKWPEMIRIRKLLDGPERISKELDDAISRFLRSFLNHVLVTLDDSPESSSPEKTEELRSLLEKLADLIEMLVKGAQSKKY